MILSNNSTDIFTKCLKEIKEKKKYKKKIKKLINKFLLITVLIYLIQIYSIKVK
jgi:hypothetical protein